MKDDLAITDIVVGARCRERLGDIESLAASIAAIGMLHPVVVTADYRLVSGQRRLEAAKLLGWGKVPVTIATSIDDAATLMRGEWDENACRKDFTPIEAESLQAKLIKLLKPEAEERRKKGRKAGGRGRRKNLVGKSHRVSKTRDKAASVTGYNEKTLRLVREIKKAAADDPETFGHLLDMLREEKPVSRVYKEMKRLAKQKAIDDAVQEMTIQSVEDIADLRCCEMKDLGATGVDAIITDPPYPEQYLPLYEELAIMAKASLKPDGVLAVMCGQSYLPQILSLMAKHIEYRWCLAYLTPGGQAVQLWQRKINTFWKPILLFGGSGSWLGDVLSSDVNDNDKTFHGWGQSESGMRRLVEAVSQPGETVCDPFLGGGTTAVVATALGRKFVGCDVNPDCIEKARKRLLLARDECKLAI